jgi:2-hydroxychromene-2-carboxylate isomerase
MSLADSIRRTIAPQLVVASSRIEWLARWNAALRRARGHSANIECYFAFDDPYAAIALPGLIKILKQRRAHLTLYPLIERGIANDPAAEARRRHAVEDSQRLARRFGKTLSRTQALTAQDCAFLAEWTQIAITDAGVVNFAAAALEQLWFQSSGPVVEHDFLTLRARYLKDRPASTAGTALTGNTARLVKRGHWESPAVFTGGQWFLAHERLAQINDHLERLGW